MKINVKSVSVQSEDVRFLELDLPVRYQEEDMPYDAPLRKGDMWHATIDVENGVVLNWPKGRSLSFYMKVTDLGCYRVLNSEAKRIASIDQDYVPSWVPGDYGDYVELSIDENGNVTNWVPAGFASEFQKWIEERFDN